MIDLALLVAAIGIWIAVAIALMKGFTGFDQDPDDHDRQ
jgi:hypothetical protein